MDYLAEAEYWEQASAYERGRENRLWKDGNFAASQNANGRSFELERRINQIPELAGRITNIPEAVSQIKIIEEEDE